MREWEELLESLLQMVIKEGNPLKKGVEDGLYLELRANNNPFVKTLNNIMKKLRLRYINEKEGLYNADDIFSITMETVIEVLFQTYIGNIRLNGINDVNIPRIDKSKLDSESDEEKIFRAEQFLKLFTNQNVNKYMAILYTAATQRDFRENFKTNHLQTTTVVSQKRVDGKMKYIYEDVYNTSIDAPTVTSKDETVDTIDYLYSKNLEMKDLCNDNVQSDINETNGIYQYILERYWNDLTNKQRDWITYAIKQDESFIKKGDNKYAPKTNRTYIEYIRDRIFKSIENDEESKVYITEKRVISWKRNNQVQDSVKKILNEENRNNQVDMLISVLNKDNMTSEVLVNHLLDYDLYKPCCDLILGKMSKYKFKTIYLDKVLNILKLIK